MAQYYPPENIQLENRKSQIANLSLRLSSRINPVYAVSGHKSLHRSITRSEYETVLEAFHALGLTKGWLQDFESHLSYRPDFSKKHPFETRPNDKS